MPKVYKRKSSFKKKKGTYRKKVKSSSFPTLNATSTSSNSRLTHKASLRTRQLMPDSYSTWITTTNAGYWPSVAGAATNSFQFAIDQIVDPLSLTGGTGKVLPNPISALATTSGAGVKNLLYNTTTSTGLYLNFRVWRVKVEIQVIPQAAPDATMIAMAPIREATNSYTTLNQIAQAPNSSSITVVSGTSAHQDSIKGNYSLPDLVGVSRTGFEAPVGLSFYVYNSAPRNFIQVGYNTVTNAIPTQPLQIMITMQQYVEFLGRADSVLLNS